MHNQKNIRKLQAKSGKQLVAKATKLGWNKISKRR